MAFIKKEFFIGTALGVLGIVLYNFITNRKEVLEDMQESISNCNINLLKTTEEPLIEDKITDYIEQLNTHIDTLEEKLNKFED